jgi:uracil-DNA glycosylase family 4
MHYLGERPDLFLLGESPGNTENDRGECFVGSTGGFLTDNVESITNEYCMDNSVRCWASHKPKSDEIKTCSEHWMSKVKETNPRYIMALGVFAAESILGHKVKMGAVVGNLKKIEVAGEERSVIFNYHPSYIQRIDGATGTKEIQVLDTYLSIWNMVDEFLKNGEPEEPEVTKITNDMTKLRLFDLLAKNKMQVAYDYECWGDVDTLRPELCDDYRILTIGLYTIDDNNFMRTPVSVQFDTLDKLASVGLKKAWKKVFKSTIHVAQNAKFEHKVNIKRFGHTNRLHDTMLAMNCINETATANLEAIAKYCKVPWAAYKSKYDKAQKEPTKVPLAQLMQYNGVDAITTRECWNHLYEIITKRKMASVLFIKELVAEHLARIESLGMCTDQAETIKIRSMTITKLNEMYEELWGMKITKKVERWAINNIKSFKSGSRFNPKSPPQMRHLCGNILKLNLPETKKKWVGGELKGGGVSMNKEALKPYEDKYPIIKMINEIRSKSALITGFLNKYEQFTDRNGRVHTVYTQEVVVTGRLSSTKPNLQNIPLESIVRKVFISGLNGYIITADYVQLEPYILAGWSGDPVMCKVLNEGLDLHRFVASQIYSVDYDAVTDYQRWIAKRRNLGSMYGQTDEGLAKATGLSLKEAQHIIKIHKKRFAVASQFRKDQSRKAVKYGYVEDLFGLRRHLPHAMSNSRKLRSRAFRQAGNFPIQSTGNTFHLLASCWAEDYFNEEKVDAIVIGVEHDKLYVDCAEHALWDACRLTEEAMLKHNDLPYWSNKPVKLRVDFKIGRDMYKMWKYDWKNDESRR